MMCSGMTRGVLFHPGGQQVKYTRVTLFSTFNIAKYAPKSKCFTRVSLTSKPQIT